MAVDVSEGSSQVRSEPTSTGTNIGRPTLRQPIFDWGSMEKYMELRNFRLEFNNIL